MAELPAIHRLPTEIIIMIFEHAVDRRPWELQKLTLVNKALRSLLLGRLYLQLHIHSMAQLRSLSLRGWPYYSSLPQSTRPLALYLQFLDLLPGKEEKDVVLDLCQKLLSLPSFIQDRIHTLGVRTVAYTGVDDGFYNFGETHPTMSWGLWACHQLPNILRLIVDASMFPPYEEENWNDADGAPRSSGLRTIPFRQITAGSDTSFINVESYAVFSNRLFDLFGEPGQNRRRFIQQFFPKIKVLYIFTVPWQQEGENYPAHLDLLYEDFDQVTKVELIVIVILNQDKLEPWCAKPCPISEGPNGTMAICVHIRKPQESQDMLAFMHQVIDDVDAEWAPQSFQGQRWNPATRPAYITAIPSIASIKRQGVSLPRRMQKQLQDW